MPTAHTVHAGRSLHGPGGGGGGWALGFTPDAIITGFVTSPVEGENTNAHSEGCVDDELGEYMPCARGVASVEKVLR